jgi:2-polyprenyl-3-methyl-5-hydroxy-6-metoxy-1,4-benzoquinol methylase
MSSAQAYTDEYHREFYKVNSLFEPGSWLEKPDANIIEIGNSFLGQAPIRVLDLGAGVGRNAIPLAKLLKDQKISIDCVDILDIAIDKLTLNAHTFGVTQSINPILADVSTYSIPTEQFDLILAESVVEHCLDMQAVLLSIQTGTKIGGFNCLSITTDLEETDISTGAKLEPSIQTNLSAIDCEALIRHLYSNWKVKKLTFSPYEEIQTRQEVAILRKAKFLFLVAERRL